jgi:hypothetical protein
LEVASIIFAQFAGPVGVSKLLRQVRHYICAKTNVEVAERGIGLENITLFRTLVA